MNHDTLLMKRLLKEMEGIKAELKEIKYHIKDKGELVL